MRFAPSPTGELHLGGARTALYNYLLAKKTGGQFIIRIEDTDQDRYIEGAAKRLLDDLFWLGLVPDEGPMPDGSFKGDYGPYVQSDRIDKYKEIIDTLLEAGHAYKDYSTPEETEQKRALIRAAGKQVLKYPDITLPKDEYEKRESAGEPYCIRLKTPTEGSISFIDAIKGDIKFDWNQIDDQVLLKSDGFPTYHLASVTDDHHMGINTVLRADEWLSSTPKHVYLYQLLGWDCPTFAHVPLILNEDKSKMSKRKDGDKVWVSSYRQRGYVPEALLNFIALLGWHESGDREHYALDELVRAFSLDRVQKNCAVFDMKKLNSINKYHLSNMPDEHMLERCEPYVRPEIKEELERMEAGLFKKASIAVKDRLHVCSDLESILEEFIGINEQFDAVHLIPKKGNREATSDMLSKIKAYIQENGLAEKTPNEISESFEVFGTEIGADREVYLRPLRVALSRRERSIDPFTLLSALPERIALERIDFAISSLSDA